MNERTGVENPFTRCQSVTKTLSSRVFTAEYYAGCRRQSQGDNTDHQGNRVLLVRFGRVTAGADGISGDRLGSFAVPFNLILAFLRFVSSLLTAVFTFNGPGRILTFLFDF